MKLKFRCWNGETMVSPDYIDREGIAHWKENSIPESTDKIMLWIGLLDKNGKEIYEGDIVTGYTSYEREDDALEWTPNNPTIVQWDKRASGFYPFILNFRWRCDVESIEVIGNIYENKELSK